MHRFRDMTTYWSKIAEKSPIHPHLARSSGMTPCEFFDQSMAVIRTYLPETRIMGLSVYQTVYISRSCFRCARHNTGVWQTDRRTDGQTDTPLSQRPAQAKLVVDSIASDMAMCGTAEPWRNSTPDCRFWKGCDVACWQTSSPGDAESDVEPETDDVVGVLIEEVQIHITQMRHP